MTSDTLEESRCSFGEKLENVILHLPEDDLEFGQVVDRFGADGLLLMCALLTLVFLVPVSIPGVSTLFGAAILLVGVSRLFNRPLWLPARIRARSIPTARLRAVLLQGLVWVRRLEKVSRAHRLSFLAHGRVIDLVNNLAFIFAALLLMAPFGFIPFSNTLPGLALLFYAIGLIQRDGVAIVLGHAASVVSVLYFGVLIAGGGVAIQQVFQYFSG